MSRLKIIVVDEENGLLPITTNSIKQNMPDWDYKVVRKGENGFVPSVFPHLTETTLCVKSGVALNLKDDDLPSAELLDKNAFIGSRLAVFADNNLYKDYYEKVGVSLNGGVIDLSIFIINPEHFDFVPVKDSGWMSKVTLKHMPRYMNHRSDVLLNTTVNARHGLRYSMIGETACAWNYVNNILSGKASVAELYSLCFDKLVPYVDGLSTQHKHNILTLSERVNQTALRLRKEILKTKLQ